MNNSSLAQLEVLTGQKTVTKKEGSDEKVIKFPQEEFKIPMHLPKGSNWWIRLVSK